MVLAEKVALYAAIRRDSKGGMSGRALEHKYGVSRRTVAKALASVWPEPRKKLPSRKTRLDLYKPLIDQMLRVDLDAPRKQRRTVKRIFDRLVEEHGAAEVSYQMVRAYVARRRPEIRIEAGRGPPKAFVPQSHQPGVEAEVDFGESRPSVSIRRWPRCRAAWTASLSTATPDPPGLRWLASVTCPIEGRTMRNRRRSLDWPGPQQQHPLGGHACRSSAGTGRARATM